MGKTTFSGPVKTGRDTGIAATTTIGTLVVEQMTTVVSTTSGASSIVIPANARFSDVQASVTVAASGNTQGVFLNIGDSADFDKFAAVKVSGVGHYRAGVAPNVAAVSAASWKTVGTSDVQLYIDVTAVSTAAQMDNFEAIVSIKYIQT